MTRGRSTDTDELPGDVRGAGAGGLTPRIPAIPPLVLQIAPAFKRRIFVDADAEAGIRRLVFVQYEMVNPGVKFSFVHPARPPAEFGAQTYQFHAYVHGHAWAYRQ